MPIKADDMLSIAVELSESTNEAKFAPASAEVITVPTIMA